MINPHVEADHSDMLYPEATVLLPHPRARRILLLFGTRSISRGPKEFVFARMTCDSLINFEGKDNNKKINFVTGFFFGQGQGQGQGQGHGQGQGQGQGEFKILRSNRQEVNLTNTAPSFLDIDQDTPYDLPSSS